MICPKEIIKGATYLVAALLAIALPIVMCVGPVRVAHARGPLLLALLGAANVIETLALLPQLQIKRSKDTDKQTDGQTDRQTHTQQETHTHTHARARLRTHTCVE